MKYSKGSCWRKWDLHIHSPASIVQYYGNRDSEEAWEVFISDLEQLPKEFSVIGINDYIFLDGYRKVLAFKKAGRLSNIDLILPVIELRIDKFVGSEKLRNINFHVLFSEDIPPDDIQTHFLNGLFNSITLSKNVKWSGLPTMESLEDLGRLLIKTAPPEERKKAKNPLKLGFDNLDFSHARIKELLAGSYLADKFMTAIGKAEWSQMSFGSSIAAKRDCIESVDFVFTAALTIDSYHRGKEKLAEQNLKANLLDCSDAHYLSTAGIQQNCIGQCFTWIKADPTFLGLRHALAEFEERVFVGDIPEKITSVKSYPTRYIKSVTFQKSPNGKIEGWFANTGTIELNSGLVSIIGNQGSGKSALTDIIGLLGNSANRITFHFLMITFFRIRKISSPLALKRV
jgi:hypothetical protein